jgi:plastocyanin
MERQLSVWAAPGLILAVALIAFVFGHAPRSGARAQPAPVAEAAPAPGASAPAALPIAVGASKEKPAEPAKPAPKEPKPVAAEPKAAASAPPKPAAASPSVGTGGAAAGPPGKLVGRIVYDGVPPPPAAPISVPAGFVAECCAAEMDTSDHSLRVSPDGGVADVVVIVKAAGAEADGSGRVFEMDQRCCRFSPHVLLVPAGATVRYLNSDPAVHNVHTYATKNGIKNSNLAAGSALELTLPKDEEFKVACDIHPWMNAYVVVAKFETSGLSDAGGRFEIDGIPPGEWAVELWGERVKAKEKKLSVRVEPGATASAEWRVGAAK